MRGDINLKTPPFSGRVPSHGTLRDRYTGTHRGTRGADSERRRRRVRSCSAVPGEGLTRASGGPLNRSTEQALRQARARNGAS